MDLRVDRNAEVPLGTQLAWRLRSLVREGQLEPGDRLPSVRELADLAGVNVNTARAVYGRLENEGLVRSEQGRGTFVARHESEGSTRRELRRQIAALETELGGRASESVRAPRAPAMARPGGRLPTTDELREIRDGLEARLFSLDAERAELLRRLAQLDGDDPAAERGRSTSTSLRGARVRWVGN